MPHAPVRKNSLRISIITTQTLENHSKCAESTSNHFVTPEISPAIPSNITLTKEHTVAVISRGPTACQGAVSAISMDLAAGAGIGFPENDRSTTSFKRYVRLTNDLSAPRTPRGRSGNAKSGLLSMWGRGMCARRRASDPQ